MLAAGAPIVKPPKVIVNVDALMIEAPEIVMLTAVADVAPHEAVRPETLLAPEATVGMTPGTKNKEG